MVFEGFDKEQEKKRWGEAAWSATFFSLFYCLEWTCTHAMQWIGGVSLLQP